MRRFTVILSQGSIPWFSLSQAINFARELGFDGIELLPLRRTAAEIQTCKSSQNSSKLKHIKSIHQSWRLDIGRDHEYGIGFPQNILFNLLRCWLFPKPNISSLCIELLINTCKLPVTVHDTSAEWSRGFSGKEYPYGIRYEIIGTKKSKEEVKGWLNNSNHSIVVDSRDDQSLLWAKNQGFLDWKEFWNWIGIKKISAIQLTFIGTNTLQNILNRKPSLPEEQLLWLRSQKWKGTVTIEANPLALFLNKGLRFKKGLLRILDFVQCTLGEGKRWS